MKMKIEKKGNKYYRKNKLDSDDFITAFVIILGILLLVFQIVRTKLGF